MESAILRRRRRSCEISSPMGPQSGLSTLQVQPPKSPKMKSMTALWSRQCRPSRPLAAAVAAKILPLQSGSAAGRPGGGPSPSGPAGARAPTRRPNTGGHHFGEFCVLTFSMHDINVHANFHHQCGYGMSIRMVKSKIHPRNAEISAHGVRG